MSVQGHLRDEGRVEVDSRPAFPSVEGNSWKRNLLTKKIVSDIVLVMDGAATLAASALSYIGYSLYSPVGVANPPELIMASVLAMLALLVALRSGRLYDFKVLARPTVQDFGKIFSRWTFVILALLAAAFVAKVSDVYSRGWFVLWFFSAYAAIVGGRIVLARFLRHQLSLGHLRRRVAIIGTGPISDRLVNHLRSEEPDVFIVGVFDDRRSRSGPDVCGIKIYGQIDNLIEFVRRSLIDEIVIALPWSAEERIMELRRKVSILPVDVRLCPDLIGFRLGGMATLSEAGKVPMLDLHRRPLNDWDPILKAVEDRVIASLALLVLAIPMLTTALLIKLDSRGPVLFRQKRHGFNNQEITVYKFRTMYHDRCDYSGTKRTEKNDPRVTRIGRFLRKSSIDELPQLLNVIKGDMSLVGPRPHAVVMYAGTKLYHEAVDEYAARHRVKPGITGWAQVNGWRGEVDTVDKAEARIACDLYYIDNWSIWFDLKILAMTPFCLLKTENAY